MRRIVVGIVIALVLVLTGFAMLVGAANDQKTKSTQIRMELQNGL